MKLVEEQALERRERILVAARECIAKRGATDLTIRDLAEACRVSVPTLYRTFGSKDALVTEAIRSFFQSSVLGDAIARTGLRGHGRMLAMIDLCGQSVLQMPEYNRQLVSLYMSAGAGRGLSWEITAEITREAHEALVEIRAAGQLQDWVQEDTLAQRIAAQCVVVSLEFAGGALSAQGYLAAFGYAAAMMLAAVTRGPAREAFEARMRAAQSDAAHLPRPTKPAKGPCADAGEQPPKH